MLAVYLRQIIKGLLQFDISTLKALGFYAAWKEYSKPTHNSLTDHQPWITFSAIKRLKSYVKKHHTVFEYGGGGSTLFFLDNAGKVITVEHDKEWFNMLRDRLSADSQPKWEGHLIPAEPLSGKKALDPANPDDYYSADEGFSQHTFRQYVTFIDRFPDHSFDIVMIDGRARTSCIKHAAPKIKKGGLLIVDNADRSYYLKNTKQYLAGFRLVENAYGPIPYNHFFSKTNIWIKA